MQRMARAAEDPNPVVSTMPVGEVESLPKCWDRDAVARIGRVYGTIGATNGMDFIARVVDGIEEASTAGEVPASEGDPATAARASAVAPAAVAVASALSVQGVQPPNSADADPGEKDDGEKEDGAGFVEGAFDGQRGLESAGKVLAETPQQQGPGGVDERSRGGRGGGNSSGAMSGGSSGGGGSGRGDKRTRSVEEEEV